MTTTETTSVKKPHSDIISTYILPKNICLVKKEFDANPAR